MEAAAALLTGEYSWTITQLRRAQEHPRHGRVSAAGREMHRMGALRRTGRARCAIAMRTALGTYEQQTTVA
eukprot:5152417-Pleurochrysis_carterae.AAC.2